MTSNLVVPIALAIVAYTLFGAFNAQAGGRIDAALSSAIFNGLAAAIALAVVAVQRLAGPAPVALRPSGVIYSVLAGVAVGVFSIVLIRIYGRGGQLSYVFPTIYGGAIALTAAVGWLVLKDDVTPLRVAGVCVIVAGIGMLALS
jgi:multidrug transporter EmrE-like cation transporter